MNSKQAKQIPLVDLMQKLGFEVKAAERGGTERKYLSPFRAEIDPSFNVNLSKNSWYDFGDAEGGNALDFAIKYLRSSGKSSRVSDALAWLETTMGAPAISRAGQTKPTQTPNLFSFSQQSGPQAPVLENEASSSLELVNVSPLKSNLIFSYLEGRKIPREVASEYLVLVRYQNKNKPSREPYFGFGQQNESGGYEIRSASDEPGKKFKSAIIARNISFHAGSEQGRGEVSVFEGMLDHLSLLAMLKVKRLKGPAIVMHSLSSFRRTVQFIRAQEFTRVHSFLDNNLSGQKHAAKFAEEFGAAHTSWSESFAPYGDLNDALIAGVVPVFSRTPEPPKL